MLVHARALLEGVGPTSVVQADIRDPEAVLHHPDVRAVIDFTQPLCVLAVAVLHFFDEAQNPYNIVARIRDALPTGSYLVLSHLTAEGTPEAEAVLDVMRRGMADPPTVRDHAEVERFFDGFELLEPGVVPVPLWRPDPPVPQQAVWQKPGDPTDDYWIYAGVGKKV